MLSEEEKEAIESFKEENNNDLSRFDDFNSYTQFKVKRDKIIINLIEKQSKEIEELKDESKEYQIGFAQGCYEKDLDWKDKIKAKIEYYEKIDNSVGKRVLQSLLEKE